MLKMHAKSAFGPLSCEAGEGWGEGALKARRANAALIRPSGTFSRKREKSLSFNIIGARGDVS